MDHKIGYAVTGYRSFRGEEAECKVGTFTEGTLIQAYSAATRAGEVWAKAQKSTFLEYHIDPVYEAEGEDQYVRFEDR
jgi:hypothetical protein